MNDRGASPRITSIARASEMHDDPAVAQVTVDSVPDPTIVPATRSRVRAACVTSSWKPNAISARPFTRPNRSPFHSIASVASSRLSDQAAPSASGVTANGAMLHAGFAWIQPKPVFISTGAILRSDQ